MMQGAGKGSRIATGEEQGEGVREEERGGK